MSLKTLTPSFWSLNKSESIGGVYLEIKNSNFFLLSLSMNRFLQFLLPEHYTRLENRKKPIKLAQ